MHGNHHLVNHIVRDHLLHDRHLYVVGVVSNPVRYQSRIRLAREWIKEMGATPGVKLTLVETAFGDRGHELREDVEAVGGHHIALRTNSEIWIKESMINIGMRDILVRHPTAKYLAWIDADIHFVDPDWVKKTTHELQHYPVIQPWSDAIDLGPNGNVVKHFKSFGAQHQKRIPKKRHHGDYYQYAHNGFAWACTRKFIQAAQGLLDIGILGSGDTHMAWAMINDVDVTVNRALAQSYKRRCREWQQRVVRVTHGEVGFIPGRIEHHFHGPKGRRYYKERWQILIENNYDPDKNLMYDSQGLLQLVNNPKLEQAIRLYNRSRCEDSIDEV